MAGMSETVYGLQFGTIWLLQYNTELNLNFRQIAKLLLSVRQYFKIEWLIYLKLCVCC